MLSYVTDTFFQYPLQDSKAKTTTDFTLFTWIILIFEVPFSQIYFLLFAKLTEKNLSGILLFISYIYFTLNLNALKPKNI